MRTRWIIILVAISALTASCAKDKLSKINSESGTQITAKFADGDTKTMLGSDNSTILWCPYDSISVFYNKIGLKFKSLNTEPTEYTVFSSESQLIFARPEDAESPYIYAIHPYSELNSQNGDTLILNVPSEQLTAAGTFAPGSFPSVARSKTTDMVFYNVCGGLRFSLTRNDITKVVFSGRNDETLSGVVSVTIDQMNKPSVKDVISGSKEIVVRSETGTFASGTWYYISAFPCSLSNGFKLTFYTSTQHASLESTTAVNVKRAVFGSIAEADSGLTFEPGGDFRIFTASLYNSSTKTSIQESSPIWDEGQKVFVSDGDSVATPEIIIRTATDGNLFTTNIWGESIVAGIPYNYFKLENNTVSCTIPSTQDGSFNDACVELAKNTMADELSFNPATALIKISIDENVDSIKISSSINVGIAGECNVNFIGTPTLVYGAQLSQYIWIKPIQSSDLFYLGILPCTNRISFELYKENKVAIANMPERTFNAAHIYSANLKNLVFETVTQDLSKGATANCYIVSSAGKYKFKTVKGNSTNSVGDVKGVKVLWETFGTTIAPSVGELIKADISYADNYITFSTNDTYKEGNAVIAAYSDANCTEGNVLWSWHIWLTDKPKEQVYNNSAGTMMDRNLGATSTTKGDVQSMGLLYQWGRKDPFLGSCPTFCSDEQIKASSTISWPSPVVSNSANGTIEYSISHPTTFIYLAYASPNGDWYYTGSSSTDNTRWHSTKTIYDPCPEGYQIPDGGNSGVWCKAFNTQSYWSTSSNWDNVNWGMDFGSTDKTLGSGTIWYPAAGSLTPGTGALQDVGTNGYSWSCTPSSYYAYGLNYTNNNGTIRPSSTRERAAGQSVRCVKEGSKPEYCDDYVDLGLSVKWATCNIGASKPEEYGRYFAWGDIAGQTWNGSKWSGGGFSTAPTCELDSNDNLKSEYDAAHVLLGGSWRMPTQTEQDELINNCTCTWISNYNGTGVAGRVFTSKINGNSIFLPAAGTSYLDDVGSFGYYWSSTFYVNEYTDKYARNIYFFSDNVYTDYNDRNKGQSIRPVTE